MAKFTPIITNSDGKEICGCICHRHDNVFHIVQCCDGINKIPPAKVVYTFPDGGKVYDDDDEQ